MEQVKEQWEIDAARRKEALADLKHYFEGWRKDVENPDEGYPFAYGVTHEVVTTITMAGGGPSAWIEYNNRTGRAKLVTSIPDYAERPLGDFTEIELSPDEAQELEQLFNLDEMALMAQEAGELVERW